LDKDLWKSLSPEMPNFLSKKRSKFFSKPKFSDKVTLMAAMSQESEEILTTKRWNWEDQEDMDDLPESPLPLENSLINRNYTPRDTMNVF